MRQFYNYYTHNLDLNNNEQYTIVMENKDIINFTGEFVLTSGIQSSQNGNFQFKNGKNFLDLNSNNIFIYNDITRTTIDYDTGLRTFYYNSNLRTDTIITFRISVLDLDNNLTVENFKYEPYFITENLNIVQNQNHTLKAIWKEL